MGSEEKKWRDLYEFDTPVIYINASKLGEEKPEIASKAKKLMHRFTEEQIIGKMDEVEAQSV